MTFRDLAKTGNFTEEQMKVLQEAYEQDKSWSHELK